MKWPTATLGKLAILGPQYGANARAIPPRGNRPRYIRITDLSVDGQLLPQTYAEADLNDWESFLLEEGDLLFARSGATVGKTYIYTTAHGLCIFAGYLIRFRLNPAIVDPKYAFYFTQSPTYQEWIASKKRVAAQPNINGTEYATLGFPLPPLSEQRRIVEILDRADALRKKRAEADAKAERIMPALFIKMFGDPATNPKGWKKARLDSNDIVKIGTHLVDPNQPRYINLPHVGGDNIERDTGRIISPKIVRDSDIRSAKFYFTKDHILYCKIRPYLNKVAFPQFEGVCSADIYPLLPNKKLVTPFFLMALLRSEAFLSYARIHSERLRMPKLNREQLGGYEIILPPIRMQELFECYIKELLARRQQQRNVGKNLEHIFANLLYRAFSGELTARWREAHKKKLLAEMEEQARALEIDHPGQGDLFERAGVKRG